MYSRFRWRGVALFFITTLTAVAQTPELSKAVQQVRGRYGQY